MTPKRTHKTWRFVLIVDSLQTGELPKQYHQYQNARYKHWLSGHRLVDIVILNVPQDMCNTVASFIAENLQPSGFYAHAICDNLLLLMFPGHLDMINIFDDNEIERVRRIGQSLCIPERQMSFESLAVNDHPHGHKNIMEKRKLDFFSPIYEGDPKTLPENTKVCLSGRVLTQKDNLIDLLTNGHLVAIRIPGNPYPQIGDLISIEGEIESFQNSKIIVSVRRWTVLTVCKSPESWKSLDGLREITIATDNSLRNAIRTRAEILKAMRHTLDHNGFLEVETNIILNVKDIAPVPHFTVLSQFDEKNSERVLRICPENQLKRMIVAGYNRVYEIGRSFRDEKCTTNHLQEFTSMECYMAWSDYREIMKLCESLIKATFKAIERNNDIINNAIEKSWKQITFRDAAVHYSGIDPDAYPDFDSLASALTTAGISINGCHHRRQLLDRLADEAIEPNLIEPTFLIEHPIETICVAKTHENDVRLLERFEGYINGLEIAHGFSELTNPQEQRNRMLSLMSEKISDGETEHPIDEEFLKSLELGLPPTAGLGIGIDRLVMLATAEPIYRTIPFASCN